MLAQQKTIVDFNKHFLLKLLSCKTPQSLNYLYFICS